MQTILGEIISVGGIIVAMVGGFIVRDRMVVRAISEGDSKLHARIDKVKDEYVRRDDLSDHIVRIEKSVAAMKEEQRRTNDEQRRTNERIDKILAAVLKADK